MSIIRKGGRGKLVAIITVLVVAIAAGAAIAYWTNSGTGTGKVKMAAAGTKFEVKSTLVEGLFPSGKKTVTVTVTNKEATGGQPEYVSAVEAKITGTTSTECKAEWFSVSPASATINKDLKPGESATTTVTVEMKDEAVNQDACESQEVELSYTAA